MIKMNYINASQVTFFRIPSVMFLGVFLEGI